MTKAIIKQFSVQKNIPTHSRRKRSCICQWERREQLCNYSTKTKKKKTKDENTNKDPTKKFPSGGKAKMRIFRKYIYTLFINVRR